VLSLAIATLVKVFHRIGSWSWNTVASNEALTDGTYKMSQLY
jgi:hypothetical protein